MAVVLCAFALPVGLLSYIQIRFNNVIILVGSLLFCFPPLTPPLPLHARGSFILRILEYFVIGFACLLLYLSPIVLDLFPFRTGGGGVWHILCSNADHDHNHYAFLPCHGGK